MFELTKAVVADLMFAMEDQEERWAIVLSSGELVKKAVLAEGGGAAGECEEIPGWSPHDGFKLMERFTAEVRVPAVRKRLQTCLARGRGVFRAFKETLAEFPEMEGRFREWKERIMGARIRAWYDELRLVQGLKGLGEEPEDSSDLVMSELGVSAGQAAEARPGFLSLLDRVSSGTCEEFPPSLLAIEGGRLRRSLEDSGWRAAWIEDGDGTVLAGAAARLEEAAGRRIGRIFFLAVDGGFRRQGFGRSLLGRLVEDLQREAVEAIVLDAALVPRAFGDVLAASGFNSYGVLAWLKP